MAIDGRHERGVATRKRLVEATLEVIGRDGLAALTHRSVAKQAEVSLALAGYHFAGIDDLITTALTDATHELIESIGATDDHDIRGLARLLTTEITDNRTRSIAWFELYLLAMRRPELRPVTLSWLDAVANAYAPQLKGASRQAFFAAIDGAILHGLFLDRPPKVREMEGLLKRIWPKP